MQLLMTTLALLVVFEGAFGATKEEISCRKYLKLVAAMDRSPLDLPPSDLTVLKVSRDSEKSAAELIRQAYGMWTSQGIYRFINFKSDEQLIEELRNYGFAVVDGSGQVVATFQLIPTDYPTPRRAGHYLERARAAVAPKFQRHGIMSSIRRLIEIKAKALKYSALVIRVAEKTDWLYRWDRRSGFVPFDSFTTPTSSDSDEGEVIRWMYKDLR